MKLIIDIPDHLYELLTKYPSDSNEGTIDNVLMKAVENGTPLEDIKAEIEKDMLYYADVRNKDSEKWCVAKRSGLNRALEIIDSTIRKALK